MKFISSTIAMAALALSASLSSCSDSDNWTPGPKEADSNPRVYFTPDNKTSYQFYDGDPRVISFTLARLSTDEAIEVPVTLSADDETITAPETVSFAAGQQTATVYVDCSEIPARQTFNIDLSIPADYAALYAQGSATLSATVAVVSWETIDSELYYYLSVNGENVYGTVNGELQYLDGTDQLRFTNFYGSGLDISFTLDATAENCSVSFMDIVPLTNVMFAADVDGYEGDAAHNAFFLYDQANASYPEFPVPDGSVNVNYFEAFRTGYTYFSLDGYAAFQGYIGLDDGSDVWASIWAIFTIPDDLKPLIKYKQ